jgi:hypothetical protein
VRVFTLVLIQPSHYDKDGYVIQWVRSPMPANSLAVLTGLARDCAARRVLGDDVQLRIISIDEANSRVRVPALVRTIRRGDSGLVSLVGVQTNQLPRALDLARRFRAASISVCIGGFHVSGCLATLPELPPELREAQALGVSLFAGEAEGGRLDRVLRDAYAGAAAVLYNLLDEPPELISAPLPFMPARHVRRTGGAQASFDAGRGCPFSCRFCTIINVQGRVSRHRSADDIEHIVRAHLDQGIHRFFISDDNFARNRSWRAILERLAALRREHVFRLVLQVDTACHRLPGFIEMAAAAGVKRVFIGLESINPANIEHAGKRQNRIDEYREMLLAWRRAGVVTAAGYIVGFPGDTPLSVEAMCVPSSVSCRSICSAFSSSPRCPAHRSTSIGLRRTPYWTMTSTATTCATRPHRTRR